MDVSTCEKLGAFYLGREKRDLRVEKLRERYAKKAATLEDRVRRARAKVEKESSRLHPRS